MDKVYKFIISILLPFTAAGIGSFFTSNSISTWYVELIKPSFNPPNWVFGPVWSILYLMIGISFYLAWTNGINRTALIIFSIQLFLNAMWTIIFFGMKLPLYAFIEIILLWISILFTIIYFYKIIPISAYLLIPYILWVTFAAVLNFSLYILN